MIAIYNDNLTITQSRYDNFSHKGINGTDLGKDFILPYDCKIVRIGTNQSKANYMVLQSTQKWNNIGSYYDYMLLAFVHMNYHHGKLNQVLKKGTRIKIGNSGMSSGSHLHLEIGLGVMSGNTFVNYETKFNLKTPLNIENAFYLKKGKKATFLYDAKYTKFRTEIPQDTYYAEIVTPLKSRFNDGGYSWFYMEFVRTPGVYTDFEANKKDSSENFKKGDFQVSRPAGWNKRGWFMHAFKNKKEKTYYYAYIVKGK